MSLNNYAYYSKTTGLIENILLIEDDVAPTLEWADGFAVAAIPEGLSGKWSMCGIGWTYTDGQFVEPPQPASLEASEPQPTMQGAQTL